MAYDGLPAYGSAGINDQLVPVFTLSAFAPGQAQAPTYSGGLKSPPTLAYPTGLSQVGYPVGDTGGTGNLNSVASNAAANPWSPTQSPVVMAIAFLLVGIIGLRIIHFKGIDK